KQALLLGLVQQGQAADRHLRLGNGCCQQGVKTTGNLLDRRPAEPRRVVMELQGQLRAAAYRHQLQLETIYAAVLPQPGERYIPVSPRKRHFVVIKRKWKYRALCFDFVPGKTFLPLL